MNEYELIKNYFQKLSKNSPSSLSLNDDVFFDKKNKLVISVDTYIEGNHFPSFAKPNLVIKKVLRASISDLISKGVRPKFYFISASGNSKNFTKFNLSKISKSSSTRVFEGVVENKGSIKADFVRVIFKVWDMDPIDGGDVMGPPVAIDSAFVKGEYIEYLSGIITDSSIKEGDQASYRVVVKLPKDIDPDSPTHWTQEINWVKNKLVWIN